MTVRSQAQSDVSGQDPDGIDWLSWEGTEWDGVPFAWQGKSKQAVCDWLRCQPNANPYVIRGLREKFYSVNPFADNANPTVAEIDAWNIEVILHFRALLGNPTPCKNNARLYLESRWAHERKHTTTWDTDYPDSFTCNCIPGPCTSCYGYAPGPCFLNGTAIDNATGHCGDAFFPGPSDRNVYINAAPYNNDLVKYPELNGYTDRHAKAGGIAWVNNLPWTIKLAKVISGWICGEGVDGGHSGPFVGPKARTNFGCSWWPNSNYSQVMFRGKWASS